MILTNPNGTETFYIEAGEKTAATIILLHGIGADANMWQPQMKSFAEAGYHLLIPDLFGHGRSAKLEHIELADWSNQIKWLLQAHDIDKCHLIGVSMGGVIAQSFLVEHHQLVDKVVISDSFAELSTFKEKMLGFSQVFGFHMFKILGTKTLAKGMRSTYKADYAKAARDYFAQVSLDVDLNQMVLARKAINKIDVVSDLENVYNQALVMVGTEFGQSFIEINQRIADALPNSKFVTLDQSMDPSNLVNPAAFEKEVLEFLQAT